MLKYSIKLTNDNIKQEEVVWREKYLAPSLSFVSGVTSQDYHLEKQDRIAASNTISHTPNSVLFIETENVTRQGFIVIKDKEYKIESDKYHDNVLNADINYSYVFLNDKYYYKQNSKFTIDKWLQKTSSILAEEKPITISVEDTAITLSLDTVVWIEDGLVIIDGEQYIYDGALKGLKRPIDDTILEPSAITKCSDIEYYPYKSTNQYEDVTKFILTKGEESSEPFENISFVKHFYYILYKNNYLSIYKDKNDFFVCDIPNSLLNGDSGVTTYSAYTDVYVENNDSPQPTVVSGDTFDVLREDFSYINIEDTEYAIESNILNANDGSEIAVYLDNSAYNVETGDIIRLVDSNKGYNIYNTYVDSGKEFVLFKGEKHEVIDKLCDKAKIGENEFDIKYLSRDEIDGGISGECVVYADDCFLSMTYASDKLTQKGLVVSGNSAVTMTYDIIHYSGITIDEVKYPIIHTTSGNSVEIDETNEYRFVVTEINGSSMLVCRPHLSSSDFSEDFIKDISKEICEYVVGNQINLTLYNKNKIFGNREITKELGISAYSGAASSDDYFNLFDNLILYTANAKIQIPLQLSAPTNTNPLQDDLVNQDFYEYEKNKAINPIIDMEKDVYYPKYFKDKYSGSSTDFKEIKEIRFNLHFRTRNLESWKVYEDYNNAAASANSLCNWFITDFYPYKQMLINGDDNTKKEKEKELLNSSDLLGLLNFTNNDVYYQKSNIAKSFLRLSFYDSTNQQTQMLLGTSTIFMNEHRLFKKFMDNSQKGVYKDRFLKFEEVFDNNPNISSKISVKTEFLATSAASASCEINDEHRLSSEFIVNNRYDTDTSSEGYYLYIFREYSEKLSPKPIYMKVEFNHAGIGRTIPFIIPMKWNEADKYGYKTPNSALTLKKNDLIELKKGIKLEDSYMQSYIPLYAVYDFKNKQYSYVFDRRYASVSEDGTLTLNLFEIKFANDQEDINAQDYEEKAKQARKDITYSTQVLAYIDKNTDMFGKDDTKECNK